MTRIEFETDLQKKGIPYNFHQAMSGSQYITIDGNQYRIADHDQPSHYQVKNYQNVNCYEDILSLVSHLERPIKRDDFIQLYVEGKTYKNHQLTNKNGYIHNGFGLFKNVETAANNLYYHLIDKPFNN